MLFTFSVWLSKAFLFSLKHVSYSSREERSYHEGPQRNYEYVCQSGGGGKSLHCGFLGKNGQARPGPGKRALMSNCHSQYYQICDHLDDTRLSGHVEEKTHPGCGWSHHSCWNPKPNKEKWTECQSLSLSALLLDFKCHMTSGSHAPMAAPSNCEPK